MTHRPVQQLVDHLWYPILVKAHGSGSCRIVEMQGKDVNRWNEMVRKQSQPTSPSRGAYV